MGVTPILTPSVLDTLRNAAGSASNWLKRDIPLDSYPHATESGLQGVANDTIGAAKGAAKGGWDLLKSAADAWNNPHAEVGDKLVPSPDATQLPSAIRDINASRDPLGTYARVAQNTASQGAGQALTALATEGAGRAIGRLAGEHPAVASQAVQEHATTGGSTFEPTTGKNLAGTRNVAVGIAPEHSVISDRPFDAQQYQDFVGTHRDLLTKNPKLAVGTHFDPATGLHRMELVGLSPSRTAATTVANSLGEGHVYDLANDEQVPTGNDPHAERPISPTTIDERIADLNARSPQKAPYSGVHYSESPIDMIDGSRRGAPSANGAQSAEASRLRLGSQTGMGEDAPAGFHTYKAGSLPDAASASKTNAYRVRGQMAFTSTDAPEFQGGYARGVQNAVDAGADAQTAHKLGLNAAENAVKNAGYDGYFSPKHPNLRFHFGNADAVPHGPSIAPDLATWEAPKSVKLSDGTTDYEPAVRNDSSKIDTDAFAKATAQARAELGPSATKEQVIARRDEIVGGKPETRDVGAQSRANNPEPTRAEARGTRTRQRTPQENADTAAFQQARRELGDSASSDDVVARAEKILGRPGAYSTKRPVTPKGVTPNGSGESMASAEAINRQTANKIRGIKYLKRDTRSGVEMPLIGPDALDVQPGPHDVIIQRSPQGDVELARGARAR